MTIAYMIVLEVCIIVFYLRHSIVLHKLQNSY